MNMEQIINEWIAAGGRIHGPNVETVTMPLHVYAEFRSRFSHENFWIVEWVQRDASGNVTYNRAPSKDRPEWAKPLSDYMRDGCTCPSGDGSLRWPCPVHPPTPDEAHKLLGTPDFNVQDGVYFRLSSAESIADAFKLGLVVQRRERGVRGVWREARADAAPGIRARLLKQGWKYRAVMP